MTLSEKAHLTDMSDYGMIYLFIYFADIRIPLEYPAAHWNLLIQLQYRSLSSRSQFHSSCNATKSKNHIPLPKIDPFQMLKSILQLPQQNYAIPHATIIRCPLTVPYRH